MILGAPELQASSSFWNQERYQKDWSIIVSSKYKFLSKKVLYHVIIICSTPLIFIFQLSIHSKQLLLSGLDIGINLVVFAILKNSFFQFFLIFLIVLEKLKKKCIFLEDQIYLKALS